MRPGSCGKASPRVKIRCDEAVSYLVAEGWPILTGAFVPNYQDLIGFTAQCGQAAANLLGQFSCLVEWAEKSDFFMLKRPIVFLATI